MRGRRRGRVRAGGDGVRAGGVLADGWAAGVLEPGAAEHAAVGEYPSQSFYYSREGGMCQLWFLFVVLAPLRQPLARGVLHASLHCHIATQLLDEVLQEL